MTRRGFVVYPRDMEFIVWLLICAVTMLAFWCHRLSTRIERLERDRSHAAEIALREMAKR